MHKAMTHDIDKNKSVQQIKSKGSDKNEKTVTPERKTKCVHKTESENKEKYGNKNTMISPKPSATKDKNVLQKENERKDNK